VDVELRRFYRSLATKSPFLRDQPLLQIAFAEIDCFVGAAEALGVKAAYVADGLAVSIPSGPAWEHPSLACEVQEVGGDDIVRRNENVRHASTAEHVKTHTEWIRHRLQSTVQSGEELWGRVSEFFPRLDFCAAVEEQMTRLPSLSLPSVVRGLFRLNAFCLSWHSGPFVADAIECA
jgi:hypothetical protein